MKNEHMIITMTTDEIKENPYVDKDGGAAFYRFIASKFTDSYDKIKKIDCTKVNVAENIRDAWFDYGEGNGISGTNLAMLILLNGPKALASVPTNCVELEAEAIEY